jgi:uncharacterized membrane protein
VTANIVKRLVLILLTAVLMLLTLLDWQSNPIRVLFAIALVTILPGYALTTAIFTSTPLGTPEKFAFSCGFSLGTVALGGLLLNYTHWGIQSASWVLLLGGISLIASVIALVRMKNEEQIDSKMGQVPFRLSQIVILIAVAVALGGVYLFARSGAEKQSMPPTTRVWMLWTDSTHMEVVLGIQNQEKVPMQYKLQLSTLRGNVQEWTSISLEAGATWEVHYDMPANVAASDLIKATLYRADNPGNVYRQVYLRRVRQ